jgi:hypothetical protein
VVVYLVYAAAWIILSGLLRAWELSMLKDTIIVVLAVGFAQRTIDTNSAPSPPSFRLAHTKYPLTPAAAMAINATVAFSGECVFQTLTDREQCAAASVAPHHRLLWSPE